jgi:chorismate synthase
VPRVVPVLEAMTACVLADLWMLHRAVHERRDA